MKIRAYLLAALAILLACPAHADQKLSQFPDVGAYQPTDDIIAYRAGAANNGDVSVSIPTLTAGVTSFNTRTGAVTLGSTDVGSAISVSPVTHQFLTGLNSAGAWTQAQPAFGDLSGTASASQLPLPASLSLGGVQSLAPVANSFMTGISTAGVPTYAQPSFSNLSGTAGGAQLPSPTTSTFGGILAQSSATAHQVVQYINASGQQVLAQLGFADFSGTISAAQLGTSYTNGQVLIGSTGTGQLVPSTLTAGSNVTITNAPGSITIAATASGGVSSFNSRTGAVSPASGDYTVSQVTGGAPLASPTFTGTVSLPAGQIVNGVTLGTAGSALAYLNAAGAYSTPATGSGSGTVSTGSTGLFAGYAALGSTVSPVGSNLISFGSSSIAHPYMSTAGVVVNDASGNLSTVSALPVGKGGLGLTSVGTSGYALVSNGTGYSFTPVGTGSIATPVSIANGGTACTTANCYYGLASYRAKMAAIKNGTASANLRECHIGDSTTFGSWSNLANAGSLPANSYPSFVSALLNSTYGIPSVANSFIGDGATTETYGANDTRIVIGGFAQDATIISLGGATFKTTAVAGTPMTFTPTTNVDTFRVLYIVQPGGGTLQLQIDSETAQTFSTAGTAGVGVAVIQSTVGVAAHTLKFTMSVGTQINAIGVSEAYDSTRKWVNIVNAGWPIATTAQISSATYAYSPGNAAALAALGCDETMIDIGINDWRGGTFVSTYPTNLQALVTAALTVGDVILKSPIPSKTTVATQAIQQQYVTSMQGIAATNNIAFFDTFTKFGTYVNGNGFGYYNNGDGLGIHLFQDGYREEAAAVASALVAQPTAINDPIYATQKTILGANPGTTNPQALADATTGFYSAGTSLLDWALAGNKTMELGTTGLSLGSLSLPETINVYSSVSGGLSIASNATAYVGVQSLSTHVFQMQAKPSTFYLQFYDTSYGSIPFAMNFGLSGGTTGQSVSTSSASVLGFSSSAMTAATTVDTALSRISANKMAVGNGTQGDFSGTLAIGSVGIGTSSPGAKLTVTGLGSTSPGSGGGYLCADSNGDFYVKSTCP